MQYALRNPEKFERLTILNTPVSTAAKLPLQIKQLGLPLIGDMLTKDPLFVDITLEKGSRLIVADEDLDVYRSPYLKSSAAGRAILAIVQNLDLTYSRRRPNQTTPDSGHFHIHVAKLNSPT